MISRYTRQTSLSMRFVNVLSYLHQDETARHDFSLNDKKELSILFAWVHPGKPAPKKEARAFSWEERPHQRAKSPQAQRLSAIHDKALSSAFFDCMVSQFTNVFRYSYRTTLLVYSYFLVFIPTIRPGTFIHLIYNH